MERDLAKDPALARANAIAAALAGDRARAEVQARAARAGGYEPWAELADALADLEAGGTRERGLARLHAVLSRRPELLRARYALAAADADAGRRAEALAAVDRLLQANPRHERARRLRGELTAAAAAVVSATPEAPPVASPPPPPEGKRGALPRNPGSAAPAGAASARGERDEGALGTSTTPSEPQPAEAMAPAQLPMLSPSKPVPERTSVPAGADGGTSPGAGGDAGGDATGRGRSRKPADEVWPEPGGG
jgi:tetratricopeptide (TPR) repeat protein